MPIYTVLATVQDPGFIHDGLLANTNYTYRVIAINAFAESVPSNLATARTLTQAAAPTTPTGLTVTAVGQGQLNVTWNASDTATTYTLTHSLTATGTFQAISTAQIGTLYSHTGLTAGSTHYYKVQASNAQGSSLFSASVSGRTDATTGTCPTGSIVVQSGDNVASVINTAAAGRTICISDGIYDVGAAVLSPASDVRIMAKNEPTLIPTSKSGVNSVRPKVHIKGTGLGGAGQGIFILGSSGGVVFHGLEISGAQGNNPPDTGRGIKASNSGTTIEYSYIHDCANQGIGQGDILVHHCEMTACGSLPYNQQGRSASAIKTTFKLTAHHNYVWECWGAAFWLDCNGQKIVCYDNLLENMRSYGIHYEICNVTSIANSKSYNNVFRGIGKHRNGTIWADIAGHAGSGLAIISSRNHEAYGNIATNCHNAGIVVGHHSDTRPLNTNPSFGTCGEGWTFQNVLVHDNVGTGNGVDYEGLNQPGVIASNNT